MRCATLLKNIVDLLHNRKTAYEMRFGEPFRGPIFPFGCEIYYEPITDDDKRKCHSLGVKVLSGIFVGYKQHHGGGWTGDLRIIDWIQMENAERPSEVYVKTFKSSEIHPVKLHDNFVFPCSTGDLRQPGVDPSSARLRGRTVRSGNPNIGKREEKINPQSTEDDPEQPVSHEDDTCNNAPQLTPLQKYELKENHITDINQDYWFVNNDVVTRYHVTPRSYLYIPQEHSFPIPLKYIDVQRKTKTNLEDLAEATTEDVWYDPENEYKIIQPSLKFVGQTRFDIIRPAPPEEYYWVMGRLTRKQETQRPENIIPEEWLHLSKKKKRQAIIDWKTLNESLQLSLIHI